jgi:hypothetical protein
MSQFPTDGITDRSDDSMSQSWKSAMADALVEPPVTRSKSHTLKDMFAKLGGKGGVVASQQNHEAIDVDHSDYDGESS